MPLVSMKKMLTDAREKKIAIGAFLPWNYLSAKAIANASKRLGQPVIYICPWQPPTHIGGFRYVTEMAKQISNELDIDIAVHADHFHGFEIAAQAIQGGYTSVMVDASRYPVEQNIIATKEVVKMAHACGVSVEAEIGRLPGNEGDEDVTDAEAFQTDPDEAAYFVEQTGVDCLAVSIGTMHGADPPGYQAELNIPRLKEISEKVKIPLVMHGGSGTPDDKVAQAIQHGIAKINVATELVTVYAKKIQELQNENPNIRYTDMIFSEAALALENLVEQKIKLFAGIQ